MRKTNRAKLMVFFSRFEGMRGEKQQQIFRTVPSLKHLWWKSCDVYELKRRSEDHSRSSEALEFEIIHLKQMLQHLTINKIPHNIADPSYPYGDNGIWEIKCEQDDFFPSYEFQL